MMIINLTQHTTTPEQALEGVFNPFNYHDIKDLLTFETMPSQEEIEARAKALAEIAVKEDAQGALIGGAPWLMSALERALREVGIYPYYAFSKRVVVETQREDGSVVKTAVFKHEGLIAAPV